MGNIVDKITVASLIGVGLTMVAGVTAIGMLGGSSKIYESVSSDIEAAQLKVDRELLSQGQESHTKDIKDLGINFLTSHGNTTIQVSGTFKDGYCIVGTNPENERTEQGLSYSYSSDGEVSKEENDCTENLSASENVAGPIIDQSEINDVDPVEIASNTFLYGLASSVGGMVLAGGITLTKNIVAKKRREEDEDEGYDDMSPMHIILDVAPRTLDATSVITVEPKIATVEKSLEEKWRGSAKRLETLKSEWSSYELDVLKVLEFPAVTNMNVPATFEFHKAMRKASHFLTEADSITADDVTEFREAVLDVEHRFEVMIAEAKRLKWNDYTEKERVSLQMAQSLLAIAINSASSPHERQIAYKRLMKEVEGIIVLPEKAVLELESKISLAIDSIAVKEPATV